MRSAVSPTIRVTTRSRSRSAYVARFPRRILRTVAEPSRDEAIPRGGVPRSEAVMRIRSILTAAALAVALPAVASADHETRYYGHETAPRYQAANKLAEVSADPRDGADRIALPRGRYAYLELRAVGAPIR